MDVNHTIVIKARPDAVWAVTMDFENWPAWNPNVRSVRRIDAGPVTLNSKASIRQSGLPELEWTVTEFEPDRHFGWESRVWGARMVARHIVDPAPAGTQNRLEVSVNNNRAPILRPLLHRVFRRAIERENAGLKAFCEGSG